MVPLTDQPLHIVLGKSALALIGFLATMMAAILILGLLAGDSNPTEKESDQSDKAVRRRRPSYGLRFETEKLLAPLPRWLLLAFRHRDERVMSLPPHFKDRS